MQESPPFDCGGIFAQLVGTKACVTGVPMTLLNSFCLFLFTQLAQTKNHDVF
jgi:hypothetical protein